MLTAAKRATVARAAASPCAGAWLCAAAIYLLLCLYDLVSKICATARHRLQCRPRGVAGGAQALHQSLHPQRVLRSTASATPLLRRPRRPNLPARPPLALTFLPHMEHTPLVYAQLWQNFPSWWRALLHSSHLPCAPGLP
jgi:hypothetical protein